ALSTGTSDVGAGLHGRLRWGGLRNDLALTVVRRFAGVSQLYAAPVFKPGDVLRVADGLLLQAGPLYGGVGGSFDLRGASAVGTSVPALFHSDLRARMNTRGWSASLDWQLGYQISRGATLALYTEGVVASTGQGTSGLQDHVPDRSRGLGFALKAAL
ncbi:MAG: hypothetical protein GWP91_19555, partial [Rhodobacterales bacterium]|nr:hypothetical protein [Rhodobacterales bacterium]